MMGRGQNTSSAVMQQRAEASDSLDDFPTPPWATRAVCEWIRTTCAPGPLTTVREPACNRGHMARVLGEYFGEVRGSDCHDYGAGYPVRDYLFGDPPRRTDWVITNPPFRLAEAFIDRALASSGQVAMFVRSAFTEGAGRYRALFAERPPSDILQFTERVVLWQGCLLDPDVPVTRWNARRGGFVVEKPASATAYCWVVWRRRDGGTRFHWIPPGTRQRLTTPGDYPPLPEHLRPRADGSDVGALI